MTGMSRKGDGLHRPAWSLALLLCLSSPALAGIVTFSPPSAFIIIPGEEIVFTLTLQATGPVTDINAADVVIGSEVPFDFAYSNEWLAAMELVTIPESVGFYPNDLLVGGLNATVGVGRSIELGTITVQTIGLGAGEYAIFVDTSVDEISGISRGLPGQEFVFEPLFGLGRIAIPEPSTLLLFGAAALVFGAVRVTGRRKASRIVLR